MKFIKFSCFFLSPCISRLQPAAARRGQVLPSSGGLMDMIWLVLSPITLLLSFIRGVFQPRPATPEAQDEGEPSAKRAREDEGKSVRPKT